MHSRPNHYLFIFLFLLSFTLSGQKKPLQKETYGVKFDPRSSTKDCIACLNNLYSRPSGVIFDIVRQDNVIYFVMNDKEWFDKIFDGRDDGLAVDIIQRKQFPCKGRNDYDMNSMVKGIMTPPVYRKSLNKNAISIPEMEVVIKIADVPDNMKEDMQLEFNLMIIKDGKLCYYVIFFDLPRSKLQLLNMDLFMDSLSTSSGNAGGSVTYNQHLEFVIPFEKNKFEYKPEDIKSLTDSLHLNRNNIKSVKIRAYSSVEGLESKNVELQQKRAGSIVKSLQSFQNVPIAEEVVASENWVEFLEQVAFTKYASMKTLSKEEIKLELEKKQVAADLEPILKTERKGILYIDLEKKTPYKNLEENDIKRQFLEAVQKKNIKEALEIQEAIFQNVDSKKYTSAILKDLEVPEEKEYGDILLNNLVHYYKSEKGNLMTTLEKMNRLRDMMPEKVLLSYNIAVIELNLFQDGELIVNRTSVLKHIRDLEKIKIDSRLIRRLMINYQIILCEYLTKEKNYSEKEKSLKYIFTNYKNINYNDEDLVRLAKYFAAFNKYDWSLKLIEHRATAINVSEDLLFYYVNLTVTDDANVGKATYNTILANAFNTNPQRFCELFGTARNGGVSFQLLKNLVLRRNFCENCATPTRKL